MLLVFLDLVGDLRLSPVLHVAEFNNPRFVFHHIILPRLTLISSFSFFMCYLQGGLRFFL